MSILFNNYKTSNIFLNKYNTHICYFHYIHLKLNKMKIENLMKKILMSTTSQPITATIIADGNYRIKHVHDAMEILHIFGFGTINSVLRNNNRTVRTFTKITKTIYLNSKRYAYKSTKSID